MRYVRKIIDLSYYEYNQSVDVYIGYDKKKHTWYYVIHNCMQKPFWISQDGFRTRKDAQDSAVSAIDNVYHFDI